jgi:protein TonB
MDQGQGKKIVWWGAASLALHATAFGWHPALSGRLQGSPTAPLHIALHWPAAERKSRPAPTEGPRPEKPPARNAAKRPARAVHTVPRLHAKSDDRNRKAVRRRPVVAPMPEATTPTHTEPVAKPATQTATSASAKDTVSTSRTGGRKGDSTSADHARRITELSRLLHEAIDRYKRYPISALRRGRQGTARIAFELRPDGNIDGLTVATTSGTRALDRAALAAVRAIVPFRRARHYLHAAERLQVDIAFRLYQD